MDAREARKTFLDYFREKGHEVLPSSSVIPHGDKTLLFTNAGMNQFKDIFTGKEKPKCRRAATVQKCIRAGGKHNDLDNVGYTTRHLTFFEMLGNFSFGDYFKKEAIEFAWELVTERFRIAPERLWITVYRDDNEARELWSRTARLPPERIVGLGEADNYWSMGDVGPCGPCSEILVDRGEAFGAATVDNGERFFEIWNLVFMQFDQKVDGSKPPLPRPCVDTGMGLERILMVLQGAASVFDTDLLRALISRIEDITGAPYTGGAEGVPHRVIADHVRSLVFAFADGAEPANEGRGYVLRRILRRAARYGRKIHQGGPLLSRLVDDVAAQMGDAFPEVRERRGFITEAIRSEEERFGETLDTGLELFEETVGRLRAAGSRRIPGAEVFKLYDTYGFPVDLVERMAQDIGFEVDLPTFETLEMEEQRERSRGSSRFQARAGAAGALEVERLPETRFRGYEATHAEAEVLAAARGGPLAGDKDLVHLVLSDTPFYAEAGGQVGDTGRIEGPGFRLEVADTQKEHGRFIHACRIVEGDPARIQPGQVVAAVVDEARRAAIERNHTATHLLHASLRRVLGTHVHQKGSLVEAARLRFDVTHFASIKPEELRRVEEIVSAEVLRDTPVETFETDYGEALKLGAMALFGEKYGDRVRVVKIGDFSLELCGGTHVRRTGELGPFMVAGEGSVSSGVRRLEALTASAADALRRGHEEIIAGLSALLKTRPESLRERVEKILEENRELKAKGAKTAGGGAPVRSTAGGSAPGGPFSPLEAVRREPLGAGQAVFLSTVLDGADGKSLREAYDGLKREGDELVAAIFSREGEPPGGSGKVQLLVGVSPALVKRGVSAQEVFAVAAARLSARGGGRPEMAQGAGSGGPQKVEDAVGAMLEFLRSKLA